MTICSAPITESDLLAFVDDRLSPGRRREIEDHLVRCPEIAHRVAADLALLEGLRLLFGRPATVPVALPVPRGWRLRNSMS
ncbi:MAG: zf-HC2 domain-containing protein [Rhodospirillaceae bacterium]|nr:zf-HC2 domain-containing protein [Rhodospirillales bacterium]